MIMSFTDARRQPTRVPLCGQVVSADADGSEGNSHVRTLLHLSPRPLEGHSAKITTRSSQVHRIARGMHGIQYSKQREMRIFLERQIKKKPEISVNVDGLNAVSYQTEIFFQSGMQPDVTQGTTL